MKPSTIWLTAVCATLLTALLFLSPTAVARPPDVPQPEGAYAIRVYYDAPADIERLAGYDVWEFNNLDEQYVLVGGDRRVLNALEADGWRVAIDPVATRHLAVDPTPPDGPGTFFGGYRTVDTIYTDLQAAATAHPAIAELVDYGDSYCKIQGGCTTVGGDAQPGYDLLAMRITNRAIPGPKPVFFLIANIHSREITTPELAMRLIDHFLDNYGSDADASWMVDHHEIWIIPVVNPDGHWLVELGTQPPYNGNPFTQRKNANRDNGCTSWPPSSGSQYGIDLNRNHSYFWNNGGSSGAPCSLTYRGPSAASEPEVNELQNLVASLIPDQRGPNPTDPAPLDTTGLFITIHSFSELVLWPWGYTTTSAPNRVGLEAIGDKMATYNGYLSCQPSICLYNVSGSSDDWAYGELGVPAFTFEVGNQFMPPYAQVDSIQWPENAPAFIYAARIARTPYMTVHGPDALNVATAVTTSTRGQRVAGGDTLTLTALLDDSDTGNDPLAGGAYYVDTPPWASGVVTGTLTAVDGTFDAPVENVTAQIDLTGLATGQHTLFVRGRDDAGNWGPVSAVFFEVNQIPVSGLTAVNDSPTLVGETTAFTATVAAGDPVSYAWNFGDGNFMAGATVTHTYAAPGVYTATVTATNAISSETVETVVTVESGTIELYIPGVFSAAKP